METREAAQRWADTWARAWPTGDAEAIVALQAEDGDHWASMFRRYHGRDGLRTYVRECFDAETRPAEVWFAEPQVDGARAAVEYWAVTYPQDKPLTITGCTVLLFTGDGLVAEARDYSHVTPERVLPPAGLFPTAVGET
ncbi:nuclear transport factor 2 family protein [Actinoplanes sp. NPDC024001]|uniref:nuclear transport factor 2 family protein n=1 Tax=Actinoplanes sp. NPDC024001 TaxID=3154598 RepID=UPI0033CCB1BC